MTEDATARERRTTWPIKRLKPHPRQDNLFTPPTADELAALAADIAANGLRDPLRILPDGTIVSGHSRLKAVRQLGWREVPVIVDAALAAAGADAVVARLIEENLVRRQLDPLGKARCLRALFAVETGWERPTRGSDSHADLRDRIAAKLGLSGRNAERYLRVLDAPSAVQQAFAAGALTLVEAARVGCLPERQRRQIADEVAAGAPAAEVVRRHLARAGGRQASLHTQMQRFENHLAAAVDALGNRAADVRAITSDTAAVLTEARAVIDQLLNTAVVLSDDPPDQQARIAALLGTLSPLGEDDQMLE